MPAGPDAICVSLYPTQPITPYHHLPLQTPSPFPILHCFPCPPVAPQVCHSHRALCSQGFAGPMEQQRSKFLGSAADLEQVLMPFVRERASWLSYYEQRTKRVNGKQVKSPAQPKSLAECPHGVWNAVRTLQWNFAIQREKVRVSMASLWDACYPHWTVKPSEDQKQSWCESMTSRFHNACLDLAQAQRRNAKWFDKVCQAGPEDSLFSSIRPYPPSPKH